MTEEQIKRYTYTKDEVDELIAEAVAQAHEADRIIMAKHNRDATIISMTVSYTHLTLPTNREV